jgi:hypothetical protein
MLPAFHTRSETSSAGKVDGLAVSRIIPGRCSAKIRLPSGESRCTSLIESDGWR